MKNKILAIIFVIFIFNSCFLFKKRTNFLIEISNDLNLSKQQITELDNINKEIIEYKNKNKELKKDLYNEFIFLLKNNKLTEENIEKLYIKNFYIDKEYYFFISEKIFNFYNILTKKQQDKLKNKTKNFKFINKKNYRKKNNKNFINLINKLNLTKSQLEKFRIIQQEIKKIKNKEKLIKNRYDIKKQILLLIINNQYSTDNVINIIENQNNKKNFDILIFNKYLEFYNILTDEQKNIIINSLEEKK